MKKKLSYRPFGEVAVQHTAGPWTAKDEGSYFWVQDGQGKLLGSADWKNDQKEFPFTVPQEEARANARLIAVAPELLALINTFLDLDQTGYAVPGDVQHGGYAKAIKTAKALVAKARGR